MKRRLLAFLLALVMTFSLVPVNAFAVESGSAEVTAPVEVAETEAAETTAEPVALLADDEEAEPVAVQAAVEPALTFGLERDEESPSNLSVNEQFGDVFTITVNEDVSYGAFEATFRYDPEVTGVIMVGAMDSSEELLFDVDLVQEEGFLALHSVNQTVAAGTHTYMIQCGGLGLGDATVTLESVKIDEQDILSEKIAAVQTVGYKVNWTEDAAYTVTGEKYAAVDETYTFTVAANEGYDATNMVVKVNGEEITGSNGQYDVANVSTDLTITVEGVTEAVKKPGLSALSFGDSASKATATMLETTAPFDPAVKEYTVLVPDCFVNFYVWATRADERSDSTVIKATYTNLNVNAERRKVIVSGAVKTVDLAGMTPEGKATNTATIAITDGDYTDEYKVNTVRVPSLSALSLDGVSFNENFHAMRIAYTATTDKASVTVAATPLDGVSTVTYNGSTNPTVPLTVGENEIKVVATDEDGYFYTYTITVTRSALEANFSVTPADAKVTVWDSKNTKLESKDGKFAVEPDETYTYLVQKDGYVSQKNTFTLKESSTIVIDLAEASENPNLDKGITAEWGNFRNGDDNLGITDAKTPYAPEDAELLWAVKYGTGWAAAPGSPILVDGDIFTNVGSTVIRLDSVTGQKVAEGQMVGTSSFSIIPMTYGDGMVFVGLSGGRIQAFNAKTLESLWVYTDELGGQPNTPITYKDGYIYAGFWNSEDRNANFVCINTIDEDHASTTEAKYATWTYTRQGGFYWAGAYVTDKLAIVGTDDGASGYKTNGAALLVFDRSTGELLDSHEGIRGDVRSNVSHDPQSDRVFFTTKGGILGNAQIDWDTGKILDYKEAVITNAKGTANAMSTCTPSVYNGRIYIGVSGNSQFGTGSGHAIAVFDLNNDGSMTQAYVYEILGYPQTSAMVTTAYSDEDGYVYIYLPYNYTPGGVSVLKDRPGQTEPVTTTNTGYSEVFTPVSPLAQYCICSTIADQYGTIYYKNDSCYVMAITSKIESLEITQNPTITENEDGTLTVDGLKAVTKLRNGEERDVSNYVSVTKNEETGGYTVSYTYGFDNANYGLKTVTAEIVNDYAVTIPEGEGYTVTGEKTAKAGEDYSFTVELDYRYEAGKDFAVKVNGETVTGENGTYTVKNVDSNLEITVTGVQEKVVEPVTVYFSFSHDDKFEFCEESGQVMALKEVTVPYFDLALYGLEDFYFSSEEYGSASGDPNDPSSGNTLEPGTKEFAYGKITGLHLYIYALEVFYKGVDPEDAGKGYLAEQGLLGSEVLNISGYPGSMYLENVWGYDYNLNYYVNYEYPLASSGYGSTCDQILIHDGDIITVGHFSDMSFYTDPTSVFNYIDAPADIEQGEELTLSVYRAGADMYGDCTTAHTPVTTCPTVYISRVDELSTGDVTQWWRAVGTADYEGKITMFADLEPGTYIFAVAGQPGENTSAICSTPGAAIVTVHAKAALKGDINGDGVVDVIDLSELYSAILSEEELDAAVADINGDGVVDVLDMAALYELIMNND